MIEKIGNIFDQPDANAICFTSNGIVKSNGELVMGAGIAKQFKAMWPMLPMYFGNLVQMEGNHVYHFLTDDDDGFTIVSFPTKNHWAMPSDMFLIEQSTKELVELTNSNNWKKVYLPRPGCGLGGLKWEDVKKVIAPILDDRFIVLTPK